MYDVHVYQVYDMKHTAASTQHYDLTHLMMTLLHVGKLVRSGYRVYCTQTPRTVCSISSQDITAVRWCLGTAAGGTAAVRSHVTKSPMLEWFNIPGTYIASLRPEPFHREQGENCKLLGHEMKHITA